ncbi:hypothetical protein NIES37_50770 [Tolypothrix tenuis PCC 7101]|uniref:Uncharacterized protein n=1 Tax=Tolypothrix tenuis PCC 7101 TaxID=231146 RepID=A0A1Z4N5R3_9CYAN|nr:hypothetical protein [Aulosira sp. FACHB-113]BAZ01079.1 hypothetical protein NIES37_50770 [Tolypothrix tenuis PCC 7101]BAZ74999.1 hypothetical protein NIES50_35790 [Aulosira laxa NIES-50]
MSNIKISEILPAGSELFQDSESFLNELTNEEILDTKGGRLPASLVTNSFISINSQINTIITANSNSINANTIGNVNTRIA